MFQQSVIIDIKFKIKYFLYQIFNNWTFNAPIISNVSKIATFSTILIIHNH